MKNAKCALITGASSGLGLELCKILRSKGIRLLVTGRKNLPEADISLQADLKWEKQKILDLIEQEVPDLVINCAGFGAYGPAIDHHLDLFELNANVPIQISLTAAKAMLKKGAPGVILNVSSAASLIPMPYLALYSAAKAALSSFSRSFDAEMSPFGIRVLVSLPGQINTEFAMKASGGKYRQKAGMKKEWAAKRIIRQIDCEIPFEVFDWKVRIGVFFAKFFPRHATQLIAKNLRKRF